MDVTYQDVRFQEIERLQPTEGFDLESRMLASCGDDSCEVRVRLPSFVAQVTQDPVDRQVPSSVLEWAAENRASGAYPREARFDCLKYGSGPLDLLAVPDANLCRMSKLWP